MKFMGEVDLGIFAPSVPAEELLDLMEDSDIIEYISGDIWTESFIYDLLDTLTEEQINLLKKVLVNGEYM